jgi:hypothetical protein
MNKQRVKGHLQSGLRSNSFTLNLVGIGLEHRKNDLARAVGTSARSTIAGPWRWDFPPMEQV